MLDCPNAKKEEADDTEEIRQEDDTKETNGPEKSPFQADDGKEKAKKYKSSFQKVSRWRKKVLSEEEESNEYGLGCGDGTVLLLRGTATSRRTGG